jgi:hypothetical protein
VQLEFDDLDWTVRALIDTGAPFTLFDRGTGDALGIDFSRHGAKRYLHKIAGGEYLASGRDGRASPPALRWETEVFFFLDDWGMPFAGLLGQEGFLDRWVVTFNRYDNYLIVEEPESFKSRLPPDPTETYEGRDLGWRGPL